MWLTKTCHFLMQSFCVQRIATGSSNVAKTSNGVCPPSSRLIVYARSSEDQVHDAQMEELRAAGCHRIYQEHGSGASQARQELTRLLAELTAGDVLVIVRLDSLARGGQNLAGVLRSPFARRSPSFGLCR
jgi:predicted site-specific integrase-resolvase